FSDLDRLQPCHRRLPQGLSGTEKIPCPSTAAPAVLRVRPVRIDNVCRCGLLGSKACGPVRARHFRVRSAARTAHRERSRSPCALHGLLALTSVPFPLTPGPLSPHLG